jgi:hypothetical protein
MQLKIAVCLLANTTKSFSHNFLASLKSQPITASSVELDALVTLKFIFILL